MTTPAVRRVSVRRGQQFSAYDMTTGEPCPAVFEVEDDVTLIIEAGIGVRTVNQQANSDRISTQELASKSLTSYEERAQ